MGAQSEQFMSMLANIASENAERRDEERDALRRKYYGRFPQENWGAKEFSEYYTYRVRYCGGGRYGDRQNISKGRRNRIHARDGFKCLNCGETDPDQLVLDHIIPICYGGLTRDCNLQTLCLKCNMKKGTRFGYYRCEK